MKTYVVLLSIALSASLAGTAQAAHHARHHHSHMAKAMVASSTDWAGNPHMTLTRNQSDAFFRDAINPMGAKW